MHVINLFSSWQHNRFVNYTKDIREIWKHCSLTLFSARYWEEEERGNRCKCNSISHGYSVRIVLIFHRWNSINWNARNQAASANFFFLFFKCSRSIDWRGDRFFILPDWIYTKAGIARGCYIKNEFSRPMLSTMVRCAWFFFFTISNC